MYFKDLPITETFWFKNDAEKVICVKNSETTCILVAGHSEVTVANPFAEVTSQKQIVPANNFISTLAENVDNKDMTDKKFREFVRNSLPIVMY